MHFLVSNSESRNFRAQIHARDRLKFEKDCRRVSLELTHIVNVYVLFFEYQIIIIYLFNSDLIVYFD